MAKIKKLKENGSTIYPATIPEGVVDTNGFTLAELLDELLEVLAGGSRGNMELAFSDLRAAIGSEDGNDLSRFVSKVNTFLNDADASDTTINRWKEIESFLTGITDTKTLTGLLNDTLTSAKSYTDTAKSALQNNLNATQTNVMTLTEKVKPFVSTSETSINAEIFESAGIYIAPIASIQTEDGPVELDGKSIVMVVGSDSGTGMLTQTVINHNAGTVKIYSRYYDSLGAFGSFTDILGEEYVLPVATASALGGVKGGGSGHDITVGSDGEVTVNKSAFANTAGSASTAGTAQAATRATQDINGADIAATYLKAAAVTDVTDYPEITI